MGRRPSFLALREELFGHGAERIGGRHLLRLPLGGRIDAVGHEPPRFVTLLPGSSEAHIGIGPQGEKLLLPSESICQAPKLSAGRRHQQVHSALIRQLERLVRCLGVADFYVGQHVGGLLVS
jgi:hypothetical protein